MYFPCFVAGTTSLPPHGCPPDIRSTHALHLRPRAVLRAQFLPNTTRSFGRMSDPCEKYPAPCPTAFLSPYSLITYAPALCAFCFPALFKYRDVPAIFRQNPFRKDARGYCAKPGRTFPGCWRASCKQKAPKPRHPSRIVFGSGASIFMTVSCHTICSRHTPVPSDISCNVEVITLEQNNRTTMIARVICAERCRLLVCDCSSHQRVLVRSDDACCFSRGDCVCIHYSGAMTMSIPPQITADCIHRHCA